MKEIPTSSWPHTNSGVLRKPETDAEPFTKAPPAPSIFHTPDALSRFAPDPLLAVTPEKTLQQCVQKAGSSSTAHHADDGGGRKGRQRVRFAPGTRTSPPSKKTGAEIKGPVAPKGSGGGVEVGSSRLAVDEESVPRSFSALSQKLYQPGRYSDQGEATDLKLASSGSSEPVCGTSAPKRYTVQTQGGKTFYVPTDCPSTIVTSDYSDLHKDKPVTARIVRHKPVNARGDSGALSTELKEAFESALDAELAEAWDSCPSMKTPPRTPPRSRSTSPTHRRASPHRSRQVSPSRNRRSPSISPSRLCSSPSPGQRLTPAEGPEAFTLDLDEGSEPVVRVVREAPYQPRRDEYVFPFGDRDEEERQVYDSGVENALARPEFNSTLKISQELKSVREKRPDAWEAVSQKLKMCDRKRVEIQEKASSRVNVHLQSGIFSDLVDVDVPLDDLCHNVEKGITLRAPSPKPAAVKVLVGKEPDVMEFFTPDLLQEFPDLTLTGIQPIMPSLTTADPVLAFDLYRHNRVWNGQTDS